jgi:hypothetical protein
MLHNLVGRIRADEIRASVIMARWGEAAGFSRRSSTGGRAVHCCCSRWLDLQSAHCLTQTTIA